MRPGCGCVFDNPRLLIDTGSRRANLAARIPVDNLSVLLTHSHVDHVGGMPALIKLKRVDSLFIPYYLPEVTSIYAYLRKHASVRMASPNWSRISALRARLVCENDKLCPKHITVLNPPKDPSSCFSMFSPRDHELSIRDALEILRRRELELPVNSILDYRTPISQEIIERQNPGYASSARVFVHRFFISLAYRVGGTPQDALDYYVDAHLELAANQASAVLVYRHPESGRWLFTGDADENVFERLISSGTDISAKYLKIPHHGSRKNMSLRTLQAISPEVAIISHGNRPFGRARDAHPHDEVIAMLDERGVRSYYTEPVKKQGRVVKPGTTGPQENGLVEFV